MLVLVVPNAPKPYRLVILPTHLGLSRFTEYQFPYDYRSQAMLVLGWEPAVLLLPEYCC